jgi:hypothetical protein
MAIEGGVAGEKLAARGALAAPTGELDGHGRSREGGMPPSCHLPPPL